MSQWVRESVSHWQALPMIGLGSDKNINAESAVFTLSCYNNYSPQRQPQPCAFHILNLLPFWKGKGLTLTFRFCKELKKHQFGQIHFSCKTNIANYSWCTCSKTSLIQQSGGPKPAEMVPPTDMEKQQVAIEARKHVQDIKKTQQKKLLCRFLLVQ